MQVISTLCSLPNIISNILLFFGNSIASAICCIAAIAGLANQETARSGNILGIAGVAFGLSATAADLAALKMHPIIFHAIVADESPFLFFLFFFYTIFKQGPGLIMLSC